MRFPAFVLLLMLASPLAAQTPPVVLAEKPAFTSLVAADAALETVATGFRFTEGTTWDAKTGVLFFSDIPASRIYRFDPAATPPAAPQIFRDPSNHANGNTCDAAGNLYTCEHETRRVTRTRPDGTVDVLADHFEGKLLNSPNDIVIKSDGTVWFTDPGYGLEKRPKEQAAFNVFCLDPKTGELRSVLNDFEGPNGLCFSPDEKLLYVADSSSKRHFVRVYDVSTDNTLTNGRPFCVVDPGVPDGMRCDRAGNLWSTAGDGVHVFNPAGERIGKILVPQTPANLCFGGPTGNDLYIAARTTVYRIKVAANTVPLKQP